MTPKLSNALMTIRAVAGPDVLLSDVTRVAGLIGLDVGARILPHAPDFTPVAATALFAASALRLRALSILVPVAAMFLADAALGFYDLRVMAAVYAALALPAVAVAASPRLRRPAMIAPVLVSSSLAFFAVTNFAVWAFSPMYSASAAGLVECYAAALPFLKNMIAGDLFWGLVLFGGSWALRNIMLPTPELPEVVARQHADAAG